MNDADKKLLELSEKANLPFEHIPTSAIDTHYITAAANAVPRLIAEKEALRNRIKAAHAICEVVACKDEPVGRAAQRWLAADDDAAKEPADD